MEIECSKCKYKWKTKSELNFVSCPSCLNKVPNPSSNTSEEVGGGSSCNMIRPRPLKPKVLKKKFEDGK